MEVPKQEGFVTIVEGNLLKKILKEGEGALPSKGQEVEALYKGTLTDGTVFDQNDDRDSPFKFTLGNGQVIKGWDQGFATMKKGERAILACGPDFAYGARGSPPKIPAGATLHFEVELLGFHDKKKEKWELSDEEKLASGAKLKETGNDHFKAGRNKEAADDYTEAISFLEDLTNEEAAKLLSVCRLNAAMAYLRTKNYSKTIEQTTKVLEKEPNNSKGLYRRGVAYLEKEEFAKSQADFELLLKNEPEDANAKKELLRLKKAVAEAKKKEKKVFGKIFASNYYEDMQPGKSEPKKGEEEYKPIESSSEEDEPKQTKTEVEKPKEEQPKIDVEPVQPTN